MFRSLKETSIVIKLRKINLYWKYLHILHSVLLFSFRPFQNKTNPVIKKDEPRMKNPSMKANQKTNYDHTFLWGTSIFPFIISASNVGCFCTKEASCWKPVQKFKRRHPIIFYSKYKWIRIDMLFHIYKSTIKSFLKK